MIFNPAARGNKAKLFRRHLEQIAAQCALKATSGPGDARRLAAQAVADGFDLIVAAGGDGTVNETLNGLGDAPEGFKRAALGILPLGTINVFARELKLPLVVQQAWEVVLRGREIMVDLPWAEYVSDGIWQRRYFAQLAGGGMDARAIQVVSWPLKQWFGPLAYVMAGLQALSETKPQITLQAAGRKLAGELMLIGNGQLYGGAFTIFPHARLNSGRFEVCGVPRMNWQTLCYCAPRLLWRGRLPDSVTERLAADHFTLSSNAPAGFELDGEWIGQLPANFGLEPQSLRVVVP